MEAARHLHAIDSNGEVVPLPEVEKLERDLKATRELIEIQNAKLNGAWSENTRLKRQLSEAMGVEPEARQITEVLTFWNDTLRAGRCKIVVGSERWLKVRQRLREKDATSKERCYTPLHLKAAVVGASLSDYHVQNGYLDAVTIFRDSKTVDDHIARAVTFRRTSGISALEVVDELAGEGLRWLAERCACGHTWIVHLRGGPRPDGTQPCTACRCEHFDDFYARVERWKRERVEPESEASEVRAALARRGVVA